MLLQKRVLRSRRVGVSVSVVGLFGILADARNFNREVWLRKKPPGHDVVKRRRRQAAEFRCATLSARARFANVAERVTLLVVLVEEDEGEPESRRSYSNSSPSGVRFDQGLWDEIYVLHRQRFSVLAINSRRKKIRITTRENYETLSGFH